MILQSSTVNVLGDSITEGSGASCTENRFTSVMERLFSMKVNNYGMGGSRIARQRIITDSRADRDFCMRAPEMDRSADAVVVFGGTNDYGHGTAPLGVMTDRTPDTFYGACHHLMTTLLDLYTGKPILICTPLRRTDEENPLGDGSKPFSVAPLRQYRDILMEVAFYYALPVLDLYSVSGIQPALPLIQARLIPDGLHPNDAGHAILARKIGMALAAL